MILILKKNIYNKLFTKQKKLYTLYTYNRTIYNNIKNNIDLYKKKLYIIYILSQDKNKLYFKELLGILIKKNKIQNLTNIHLLCLKKYNNIYLSFFKENPNILIKYKI